MNASKLTAPSSASTIHAVPAPQRTQREPANQASQATRPPEANEGAKLSAGATTNGLGQTVGGTFSAVA